MKCFRCTSWPCTCRDGITLIHGDCLTSLAAIDETIHCTVTSPPYNQMDAMHGKESGTWAKSNGGLGFIQNWKANGYIDSMPEDDYQAWQNEVFSIIQHITADGGSLFYNHQIRWRDSVCLHPVKWFQPDGFDLRSEIVWDRGGGMMFNARMFVRFDERILWYTTGKSWTWNQEAVGYGTVWRIARLQQQQGKLHPVQFPMDIPQRCIQATTEETNLVLDPFCGAGTTLVAAKKLRRRAIGIEQSERYCEIAANRLRQEVFQFTE